MKSEVVMSPNSPNAFSKVLGMYCMSEGFILRKGQGQGQVTKGHFRYKILFPGVTHVLWAISHVEYTIDNGFAV